MTASPIRNRLVVASCLLLSAAFSACSAKPSDVSQVSSALNSGAHTNAVTIDGVLSTGEWSDAASVPLSFCGGDNPGTLYVKNDGNDLYIAMEVQNAHWRFGPPPPGGQMGNDFLNMAFDNDGDGAVELRDNYWAVRGGDGLTVDNYNQDGSPQHAFDDKFEGGTTDLVGAVTHTNPVWDGVGTYVVEYRGPLDTTDDTHDFSLRPGDTTGVTAVFATAAPCNGSRYLPSGDSFFPITLSGGTPVLLPDGSSCTADAVCASSHCADGFCCNSACAGGACETCAAAKGASANGVCTTLGTSHTCRAAVDACDAAEVCNGMDGACPADRVVAAGAVCRSAMGTCDVAEKCNGTSTNCPADVVVSAGVVCRPLGGACDVAETCNGSSPACPTDGFAALGTVCHTPAGPCESTEVCPGDAAACPAATASPSPSCTFLLAATASRVLMANTLATATPAKRQDDMFASTVSSNPTVLEVANVSPFRNTFTLDDWTVMDGAVSMTVGSRVQGTSSLGHLTGRVQCDSSTPNPADLSLIDPNNSFSKGTESLRWSDQLTVTSGSLGSGAPVQFLLQLELDSHLTNLGEETSGVPVSFQTFAYGTATAGGTNLSLMDNLYTPLVTRSTTAVVNTAVGSKLTIAGTLQVQAAARLKVQTPVQVIADAGNTAIVRLTPITPGVSYTAASGRGLYAPDSVAPSVRIVEPHGGKFVRGMEQVLVQARDAGSGVGLVQVWAGDTLIGACHDQKPCHVWLDTRRFPEGLLVLRATAQDFEGNVSTDHEWVIVDNGRGNKRPADDRYDGHW